MTALSPHFLLEEFCTSQMAARMGRPIVPDESIIENLERLCTTVLEPLRAAVGAPLQISSGYRPPWLNAAIGGASDSAHQFGRAADIIVPGRSPLEICRLVQSLDLPIDQCLLEFSEWTHCGIADALSMPRLQYLTAQHVSGHTVYTEGLA